ncbi:hypothetical protein [Antarctobacter jejuensis]|uniref:hypothetical protein n=1 Tax=Antarctobacter jejuensis TaxID=1439938 RepID=UPI003FD32278
MCHRRSIALCCLLALSGLPAWSETVGTNSAPVGDGPSMDIAQQALVSGRYSGQWHDGRTLAQTIVMITPDMITLQRHAYSSTPVTFRRVEPDLFRDRDGNTLTLIDPERVIWRDRAGDLSVVYTRTP